MTQTFTVQQDHTVTQQDIADWVTTAFEGGSNYWIDQVEVVQRDSQGQWQPLSGDAISALQIDGVGPYANPEFWVNDSRGYRITYDEEAIKKVLTASSLVKAFGYQPKIFKGQCKNWFRKVCDQMLSENYDAGDADIMVQVAILNEVVYG